MNSGLLLGCTAFSLLASAPMARAAASTYDITTTWYEPATAPRDSIFIGTFDYDASTHIITNLKGILSESMSGDRIAYDPAMGPGQHDNMVWLGLDNASNREWGATHAYLGGKQYSEAEILALQQKYQISRGLNNQLIPSWYDATLGGTFAVTFRNDNTNTFTTMFGGDGWSPQAGVDVGMVYYGYPLASRNVGNAYALIFVPDSLSSANTTSNPLTLTWREGQVDQATGEVITPSTGDRGLAYTAYADCVPTVNPSGPYDFGGGMMGAVCMTGTSWDAYGAIGSMGGTPHSQVITAAVPEPETYVMLLAGLGLIGAMVRRRRQARSDYPMTVCSLNRSRNSNKGVSI